MATPLDDSRPAYPARSRSRSRSRSPGPGPGGDRFRGAPPRGGYRAEGPRRNQVSARLCSSHPAQAFNQHHLCPLNRRQKLLKSLASLL